MSITWKIMEEDENGTLIQFEKDGHKTHSRMGETFTSTKKSGTMEYDDIEKWLVRHHDLIKKMFAEQTDDDFKDEGVFEL
tara:strand:+ start:80 stop:319 length:240 start_codon:yes stop_codon:yes gene_type:complete